MNYYRIYFDILSSIIDFFVLELFVSHFTKSFNLRHKHILRYAFLIIYIIYAIMPNISMSYFINLAIQISYVFLSTKSSIKGKLILFFKYFIFNLFISSVPLLLSVVINNDIFIANSNNLYLQYKVLINTALSFIVLSMYINTTELKLIGVKTSYKRSFNIILILCVITLAIISMLLGSNLIEQEKAMPIAFSLVILIIFACLSVYHNIITSVENDAKQKIQIEKYELEDEYYKKIDDSLKSISSLRHDFKNHLIIIDGYANENKIDEIKKYVNKINSTLTQITIIKSESTLLSSILNTKKQDCLQANVAFEYNLDFCKINIDDFYLVTILGNILDNAITASSKVANGFISIIIRQLDSYLEIICSNSHCENLTKKDGFFITTKENPGPFHGIGLSNVVHTIEDIDGTINFKYDASTFSVDILLPNYN